MSNEELERRRQARLRAPKEGTSKEAVELLGKMFFVMGIDPDNEESLAKGRDNFRFIENVRITYENRKLWVERAIITVFITTLAAMLVSAASHWIALVGKH